MALRPLRSLREIFYFAFIGSAIAGYLTLTGTDYERKADATTEFVSRRGRRVRRGLSVQMLFLF